jgi:pimeloyl-ACP methyl ester carboxylesterase
MSLAAPYGLSGMTTQTLDVPGATLAYDIRDPETASGAPTLLLIGYPMDARGFTSLSGHFRDRTVVTYDPRGVSRSERTETATESTPDLHADDLERLIAALDGPVDVFASSGGAVNGLALVARRPDLVRTLVAHEPPAAAALPDRDEALAATRDIHETYMRDGFGAGMAKFMALTSHRGPVPADFADRDVPDPTAFGFPAADDGSRDDPMLGRHLVNGTHYEHDFDALRVASTRIVVGVGAESEGELAHRSGLGVAERLGTEPVVFPSHHGGFLGGEFGWAGDPDAFAVTLREVLDA